MKEEQTLLFEDFAPISTENWLGQIEKDLKGADFEKRLVWRTDEGFKISPFYRQEDIENLPNKEAQPGKFPFLRSTKVMGNTWLVRQKIVVNDVNEANAKALDILNKGVDSITFSIRKELISDDSIKALMVGISPKAVEINFETCQRSVVELAKVMVEYYKKSAYKAEEIHGTILFDPFAAILKKGVNAPDFTETATALIEITRDYPTLRTVAVRASLLSDAGAYTFQELGYALAWGNEQVRLLIEVGVPASTAARNIAFNFGVGSNYFVEIAKFRAARLLWAQIVHAYEPKCSCGGGCRCDERDGTCQCAQKIYVHAETSKFNLTFFDSHVNLLRTQTEAMSAALGGVDALTVTPFDYTYADPNEFSERLARNQQLLLKEESHFEKVADPAAGSYYIETLTNSIAEQAWKLFLEVEEQGGFLANIKSGAVQQAVNDTHKARIEAIAKRKEVLLGTNQFPNFVETSGEKKPHEFTACGCMGDAAKAYLTLNLARQATEYEALRLQTEQSEKTPTAFMLTIGSLAMRQARAQFSCNFLACAGYKVIDNLGFPTVEAGVEAALNAKADIVVICSSDDEYIEYAPAAYRLLNNRALFIVAGNPACAEELKAVGIEHFIHVRVNVLNTLKELSAKLAK